MKTTKLIRLSIAELAVSSEPAVISTILGSCVSVCIHSPRAKVGGMIHYALPSREYAHSSAGDPSDPASEPLRFGENALPSLISEVCRKASVPAHDLTAKIVGGASVVDELKRSAQIGPLNLSIAEKLLKEHGIKVIGRDVGGTAGRKVYFFTDTGRLRVAPLRETGIPAPVSASPKQPEPSARKRVLIIDDSKTIRDLLVRTLRQDPGLEVVGTAADPIEAEPLITSLRPDVLTLDLHMPRMDGVAFLEKLMPSRPLPVVVITSFNTEESDAVFRALELGAVDYIQKPSLPQLRELGPAICEKVRAAASVHVRRPRRVSPIRSHALRQPSCNLSTVVAIGSSTGGTEALKEVLLRLPKEIPPIVIVQHIPPVFSTAFSKRLNELCPFEVKEAQDNDVLNPGQVLIAPGGLQMKVEPFGKGFRARVFDGPPVNRHKPSVDVLFDSVACHLGKNSIGIILTGMGSDGAAGLLRMRKAGARTMAQDEETCVVYGMPKAAVELGGVEEIHPLTEIPAVLLKWLSERRSMGSGVKAKAVGTR